MATTEISAGEFRSIIGIPDYFCSWIPFVTKRNNNGSVAGELGKVTAGLKSLYWILGIVFVLFFGIIGWLIASYVPGQVDRAVKSTINDQYSDRNKDLETLKVQIASLTQNAADTSKRLDRLQASLAARGTIGPEAASHRFTEIKKAIAESLAANQAGDLPKIRQDAVVVTATLKQANLPLSVIDKGVSTLVYVSAYKYFTTEIPKNPNLLMRNFSVMGSREAIMVGHGPSVVMDGGTIKDSGQELTGIYWIGTTFENSTIRYHGGPLYLADVIFKNCKFDFGGDAQSQRVKQYLIEHSKKEKPANLLLAADFSSLDLHPNN